ncbi:MAG: hypothetical protein M3Y77_16115 [Actinomycetota bacterium]|nr:hypothetical protein [Actinomycetota bacterium]
MTLEIVRVRDDSAAAEWRAVHNLVIATAPLSADDVRDRVVQHRLALAYADGVLVGNSTVRPATQTEPATVIVRILPAWRRRGLGTEYFHRLTTQDPSLLGQDVATVVLTANRDGLAFCARHGFVEVERYEVDGSEYADFIRTSPASRRDLLTMLTGQMGDITVSGERDAQDDLCLGHAQLSDLVSGQRSAWRELGRRSRQGRRSRCGCGPLSDRNVVRSAVCRRSRLVAVRVCGRLAAGLARG